MTGEPFQVSLVVPDHSREQLELSRPRSSFPFIKSPLTAQAKSSHQSKHYDLGQALGVEAETYNPLLHTNFYCTE
jgi:hypothetical protein